MTTTIPSDTSWPGRAGCGAIGEGRHPVVAVAGAGELPDAICRTLREVVTDVDAGEFVLDAVEQHAKDLPGSPPPLVVLPCRDGISPHAYGTWQRHRVPHLPVIVSGRRLMVGPLVRPGQGGPCLRCLDLHRADRDPGWPDTATQLESAWPIPRPIGAPAELSAVAGALVALVVRGLLTGNVLPPGLCFSVTSPEPRVRHRVWSPHISCDCWSDMLARSAQDQGPQ